MSDGREFLIKDPEITCWDAAAPPDEAHGGAGWQLLAALGMLLFVLGWPLTLMYILYMGWRKKKLYTPDHMALYQKLYRRWEPEYFYWELVLLLRRVALVLVRVFINRRGATRWSIQGWLQAFSVILVFILALLAHSFTRPYANGRIDFLEFFYLVSLIFYCIIGMMKKTEAEDESLKFDGGDATFAGYSGMPALFWFITFIVWALLVYNIYTDHLEMKKRHVEARGKIWNTPQWETDLLRKVVMTKKNYLLWEEQMLDNVETRIKKWKRKWKNRKKRAATARGNTNIASEYPDFD